MIRSARHSCPVPGCGNSRERWATVCRACWYRLPGDLREAVNSAKAAKARHREATAAIAATRWLTEHSPSFQAARLLGEADGSPAPP